MSSFKVTKLEGKTLEKDAFSFQLLDDKGNIYKLSKMMRMVE